MTYYLTKGVFEGETKWIENFGKKIRMKTFLEHIWLGREEGK